MKVTGKNIKIDGSFEESKASSKNSPKTKRVKVPSKTKDVEANEENHARNRNNTSEDRTNEVEREADNGMYVPMNGDKPRKNRMKVPSKTNDVKAMEEKSARNGDKTSEDRTMGVERKTTNDIEANDARDELRKDRNQKEAMNTKTDIESIESFESFESREERRARGGPMYYENETKSCCGFKAKLFVFFVVVGAGVGALFGFVGLDQVKSWLGMGDATPSDPTGGFNGDPTESPTASPPFQFMQCPETGDCCNGLGSNCNLGVNEMLFGSVHNANHDNSTAFSNNEKPLEDALEAGYRGLMLDVCKCPVEGTDGTPIATEIVFCHGECGFGYRNPTEVFRNINKFLNKHPTEALLINFELSVNSPTAAELWGVIGAINGINNKAYIYDGGSWPTLKSLLDSGKQLLLFKHGGAQCTNGGEGCVNKILEFHDYAFETKYTFGGVDEVENIASSCSVHRGADSTKAFYAVNNFVTNFLKAPSKSASEIVNSKDFLTKRLEDCKKVTGFAPNIINVDFWQTGDVLEVVHDTNKERANN